MDGGGWAIGNGILLHVRQRGVYTVSTVNVFADAYGFIW